MKDDPESIKRVKVGSIMQIVPEEDHGLGCHFLFVTRLEGWGVRGLDFSGNEISRTWNLVENTGGIAVFDPRTRRRITPEKPPEKHHP